eukprot:gene31063-7157_t
MAGGWGSNSRPDFGVAITNSTGSKAVEIDRKKGPEGLAGANFKPVSTLGSISLGSRLNGLVIQDQGPVYAARPSLRTPTRELAGVLLSNCSARQRTTNVSGSLYLLDDCVLHQIFSLLDPPDLATLCLTSHAVRHNALLNIKHLHLDAHDFMAQPRATRGTAATWRAGHQPTHNQLSQLPAPPHLLKPLALRPGSFPAAASARLRVNVDAPLFSRDKLQIYSDNRATIAKSWVDHGPIG